MGLGVGALGPSGPPVTGAVAHIHPVVGHCTARLIGAPLLQSLRAHNLLFFFLRCFSSLRGLKDSAQILLASTKLALEKRRKQTAVACSQPDKRRCN